MRWTKTLIPTLKEAPQEAETISHQLMLRSGLVRMLMAGVYSYLPVGLKVLNNIERIIREEMNACGANEVLLPALQPKELWQKTGRDKDIGEVMIRFVDRRGRNICLGPTHEEVITDLLRAYVSSYKQLPVLLYQIQTKFRDEMRPRFGLIRCCEFIMKDAYSFDKDEEGLDKNYQAMHKAYQNIFSRMGLKYLSVSADSGVMGGKVSHEFMIPAQSGEDIVWLCPKCSHTISYKEEMASCCVKCNTPQKKTNTIEVGHIFKLGTKYTEILEAKFLDAQGKNHPIIMGCYGIGVSRLIPTIIEQNHDAQGIIWPAQVSPYAVEILVLDTADVNMSKMADDLYKSLEKEGIEVLLDDRDERAGVKFKDADLLGCTVQVIVGKEAIKNNAFEIKVRRTGEKISSPSAEVVGRILGLIK